MWWPFNRKEKIVIPKEEKTGPWELKHLCICGVLHDSKVEVCGQCGEIHTAPIVGRWVWEVDPNLPGWSWDNCDGKCYDLPHLQENVSKARWEAKQRWIGAMWLRYTSEGVFNTKMKQHKYELPPAAPVEEITDCPTQ